MGAWRRLVTVVASAGVVVAMASPAAYAGPIIAPPFVSAEALGSTSIKVTWSATAGATSYRVSRGVVSGGPYSVVTSTAGLEYTDQGLAPATTYYYVVQSVGRKVSPYSAQVSATTVFTAPGGIRMSSTETTSQISWEPVAGAARYDVVRTEPDQSEVVTSTMANSVQQEGLRSGTWYPYRVEAVAANGSRGVSRTATLITGPATTTTLAISPSRSEVGQWVLLSATVKRADGTSPRGYVEFMTRDTLLGRAEVELNGTADLALSLGTEPVSIYARFEGDNSWLDPAGGSTSAGYVPHGIDPAYSSFNFQPSRWLAAESDEHAVAIGDLTGDGLNDVVLTTASTPSLGDHSVYLYAQQSDHTLAAPVKYLTSTDVGGTMFPIIADLDADGTVELLVSSGQGLDVFRRSGSGLLPPTALSLGGPVEDFEVTDVDGDGARDVVAALSSGVTVIRYGLPGGGFAEPLAVPSQLAGILEVADVTGDSKPDLIWLGSTVHVATQTSARVFSTPVSHTVPTGYWRGFGSLRTGDVTGDGRADIVITVDGNRPGSRVVVFTHNPAGELATFVSYPVYDAPETVVLEDMNGDGRLDVVLAHGGWYQVGVVLQRPDGRLGREFFEWIPYASHYSYHGLAVGDINGDGRKDAVLADYNNGLVVVAQ